MTKSVLSEQREADEALCKRLDRNAGWRDERWRCITDPNLLAEAASRIRALSEALQEACHERDGLLVPEWQPIETAPRDGTWVDLWLVAPDGVHGCRIADCKWNNNRSFLAGSFRVAQPDAWVHRHGGEVHLDGGYLSHWMPLPTPPGEK